MTTEWYVQTDGQEYGPFTSRQLKQYADEGRIREETPVKQGSDGKWSAASRVRGLFAAVGPAVETFPPITPVTPPRPGLPRPMLPPPVPQPPELPPVDFLSQLSAGHARPPAGGGYASPQRGSAATDYSSVKKKKSANFNIAIGILSAVIALVTLLVSTGVFSNTQKQLEQEAARLNRTLPVQIDEMTRLDRVDVAPGKVCTMIYTLNRDLTAEEKRAAQATVVRNAREEPSIKKLLRAGCTLRVRYLNPAGQKILEVGV